MKIVLVCPSCGCDRWEHVPDSDLYLECANCGSEVMVDMMTPTEVE